jgi:RHS repeat-associated protein
MSNKSGTSSQVISLPQGGGALHGIGEKFAPDLHTGTGNFTIPIALPPGRNGFQPQLNLVYSTGNGNGAFGLGWSLSIPGVSRQTSKGIPRYDDVKDTFVLSGAEDLVPVGQNVGSTRYQPRTEGLFAKITHRRDSKNNYWEVKSKDGLVSVYGTVRPDNAALNWQDSAVITDPSNQEKVFAWKLTQTQDPFGNRIEYEYLRNARNTGTHQWDLPYLTEIRYVDYGDRAKPNFLVRVRFTYEDRPDPFSEYRAGFEMRTTQRCRRIDILMHEKPDNPETLVRTYHFVYLDDLSDRDRSHTPLDVFLNRQPQTISSKELPLNGVSLLSQVQVEGRDGDQSEFLSPLEFSYTQFKPQGRDFFPVSGPDMPPGSLARPEYELADLFGNGLPDVLEMNGTVRYWRNLGNGQFDRPREMKDAPAGLQLADPGLQMIDADGDGRIDLLVTTPGLSGYFPLRFDGLWDRKSFQRYDVAPSFNLEDPEVKLVDLTGDGVTDAIRSGSRMECFFNDPKKGWKETKWIERQALKKFPNVNFSDPRVKWGDMTGDGLQDILLVHDGNIEYWPNLGYGDWGNCISMHNSPRFAYGYDPKRILVGDVDGDGLADIVYVDDKKVILWINQSGNGWSDPIEIKGTPTVSDMDAVRLVDLLGTGIAGVLWSADLSGLSRQSMFFLDFTGGVKPYLLSEMDNHLGSLTRVGYQPSIRFYLDDEQKSETRWKTSLPFPVQVVAKVEVIDQISNSKLTTEYRYHHGYWDGAEREFRGFGRVEQRDTEIFEDFHIDGLHPDKPFEPVTAKVFSPPLETRTWFHQGPVGEEFGGWYELDYSNEFWADDLPMLARPPTMEDLLKGLSRRVKRDAFRALRGSILRTELYALDGTERQDRPYTVTESIQGVREESPATARDLEQISFPERKPIFFSFALAERTTQWERGYEPMTQFKFMGDYDPYGQLLSQIGIAVPRNRDFRVELPDPQSPYLSTYSETTYAQRNDEQIFIVDRVAQTTTYEILNDGQLTVFQLWARAKTDPASRKIIGQTLNFYDGEAFEGLGFRQIGEYGALVRSLTLVMTEEDLQNAYGAKRPPYLTNPVNWTENYPQGFRSQFPTLAGYVFQAAGAEVAAGYFAIAERRKYDFHDNELGAEKRGLVRVLRDPLGRDTTIEYDEPNRPYRLLPTKVTDPVGLTTEASYDYRVLQPRMVTDTNGNQAEVRFTPLGLLKETWVKGNPGKTEGDRTRPSVRMEYGFLAFENSLPENRQPIFVRSLAQIHHDTETDVLLPKRDETITTVEYSDGFGRLLQTRTQAEAIVFGDSIFGDAGLPASQTEANQDAVGRVPCPGGVSVVVSGWQTYDNKGRVVEKYEPFFDCGWEYVQPTAAQMGQKIVLFYDPRGQTIRTLNPDGSEQRVIYGIPEDLTKPGLFKPTPWEAYTYDANDLAPLSFSPTEMLADGSPKTLSDRAPASHHYTPARIEIDALGRTVKAVQQNGPNPATDWYTTRTTYDIRGNVLTITDALGRLAFRHIYDLANRNLRIDSIDAGVRYMMPDVLGNPVEQWDGKGALTLHTCDRLNRPTHLWARDGEGQVITLRQRLIYGDSPESGMTRAQAQANNLLGKPYRHYDEAGLVTMAACDFKGNPLSKVQQVIRDEQILAVFNPAPANNWQVEAYRVNWQPTAGVALDAHANALLEAKVYITSMEYDALNRVKVMRYPQDVNNTRKELRPEYNRAGGLEQVLLDGKPYVKRIAYNAKGQRVLIAYGNGVMTRHTYEPRTFRLVRMKSERYTQPETLTYRSTGAALQDFAYEYDLVGNITAIRDRTPRSGVANNLPLGADALDRAFSYDPLYRLLSATGRECKDIPQPRPWEDEPRCGFNAGNHGTPNQDNAPNLTSLYREGYEYDAGGNILSLKHQQLSPGGIWETNWSRNFGMGEFTPDQWQQEWVAHLNQSWQNPPSNRLTHLESRRSGVANPSVVAQTHFFDHNGNLIRENNSRHFEWDYGDRMRVFRTQTGNAEPSVYAHYLYDASGQRVKKLVRKQGGQIEVTVYIDGVFEYQRIVQGGVTRENNTLHVMDNQSRIALVRVGTPFPDDTTPAVKFHLGDHLGSSHVVVDEAGNWVNREEYTPYGETSFGSFARKRYRFTGKERDEESGLNYHGARYYAPWLIRWTSCDPLGMTDGLNLYTYTGNNPIAKNDPTGTTGENDLGGSSLPGGADPPPNTTSHLPIPDRDASTPSETPTVNVHDLPDAPSQAANGSGKANLPASVVGGAVAGVIAGAKNITQLPSPPTPPAIDPIPPTPPATDPFAYKYMPYKAPPPEAPIAVEAPSAPGVPGAPAVSGGSRILGFLSRVVRIGGLVITIATTVGSCGSTPEDIARREDEREAEAMRLGPHDHHIFPEAYREEFMKIGIDVDFYTITIPADKHIGKNGLHKQLDYNGEWHDFFYSGGEKPTKEGAGLLSSWLLKRAGLDDPVKYPVHPYRKQDNYSK